ncbi:hypothetical protein BDN71DRAFT_1505521 [Pleurotus eryngii]|uniref:Uncharacterized protein n=1 Tax=Pleurotus eryngii TaxID=5323 RepID=A0A9P6DGX7_PLEER|nr:hypothetical protein BDN71DRAFT_1505521 [Pleurotus eryngii]
MLDTDDSNTDGNDNNAQDSQCHTNTTFKLFEPPSPPPPLSPSPTPSPALLYITAASPFPQSVNLEELGPHLQTILPMTNCQPLAFAYNTRFAPSTSRLQPIDDATQYILQDEIAAMPEIEPARGKGGRGCGVKKPWGKAAAAGVWDEQPHHTSARMART